MTRELSAQRKPSLALAFDFGLRVIGVAAGDSLTGRAHPRPAIHCGAAGPDWRAIEAAIADLHPAVLVVGAPYNVDGSPGPMTQAAAAFAEQLRLRFPLPVAEVDERWSSLEAAAELKSQRASGSRRRRVSREDLDSAAAAVILERWLAGEGQQADGGR